MPDTTRTIDSNEYSAVSETVAEVVVDLVLQPVVVVVDDAFFACIHAPPTVSCETCCFSLYPTVVTLNISTFATDDDSSERRLLYVCSPLVI